MVKKWCKLGALLETNIQRKIIHIDMDCFYAAIEIRDNPSLTNKPVAVGGSATHRGVLCTCNYIARQYGVRSAMPTAYAHRLCPDLVVLPVNMNKYREAAKKIHAIFREFTPLVEPLSLDEAYLDVSESPHCQGSATLIAKEIRQRIWAEVAITASAGVAPNKFLAKIASGWKKPDGLMVIRPQDVDNFVKKLPIEELFGVGKVTAKKLHTAGFKLCSDLQAISLVQLTEKFGKLGQQLYEQSRGNDERSVVPDRIRKSLSVEETFTQNICNLEDCIPVIDLLFQRLLHRIKDSEPDRPIKNQYIKIKYGDFKQTTIERASSEPDLIQFKKLLYEGIKREKISIRLLGLGIHFQPRNATHLATQQSLLP
jgi:DNA polymerase-4